MLCSGLAGLLQKFSLFGNLIDSTWRNGDQWQAWLLVESSSEQCEVTVDCYNSGLQLSMMTGSLLVLHGHGHGLWEFIHKFLQGLPETADV